jgi:hypothetical protein
MRFLLRVAAATALAIALPALTPPQRAVLLSPPPDYLGNVATRAAQADSFGSSNTQLQTRTYHIARTGFAVARIAVQVGTPSWEPFQPGTITATCALEYPAGTFNQCKFSGAASGVSSSGQYALVSDPIALAVAVPKGAGFWVRIHWANAGTGLLYSGLGSSSLDLMTFGTSVADQTMGGTVTQTSAGLTFFPLAILAMTQAPDVCLLGDSRVAGFHDTPNAAGDAGELARSIGPTLAYIRMGIPGSETPSVISGHQDLAAVAPYCSHFIANWSINDFPNLTAAQEIANNQTIRGYFAGKPYYLTTVAPATSSSDNWETLANQTILSSNANRLAYNDSLRGSIPAGISGIFDTDAVLESALSPDSGKWIVNGTANYATADGTHESPTGYGLLQSSGAINPALFQPVRPAP